MADGSVAPGNKTTQKASSPIDIFKRESSNKAEKLTAWLLACTHTHTHTDTSSLTHITWGGGAIQLTLKIPAVFSERE